MITPAYAPTATERVLPRLALDFTTAVADPRVATSRAGNTATRINSSGVIEIVNANLPRYDFAPTTLVCRGQLIEEARTNLLLNSLIDGTALSTQTVAVTAAAHTISFYGTGTIILSGAATATVTGAGAYPSRQTLTFTPTAGNLICTVAGSVQYAQLEAGAFATSYIPTTTTSLTRNADVVSMTGTNLTSWLNVSQGTFVAIGDGYSIINANALCALSAGASYGAGNGLLIRANGNTGQIGGNASSTSSPFTRVDNVTFTICGTYSGLNAISAVNGANASSITNLDFTGAGTTTFVIGALTTGGSNILNGHVAKIFYYPQLFAQSQVVAYSKFGV